MAEFESILSNVERIFGQMIEWLSHPESCIIVALSTLVLIVLTAYIRVQLKEYARRRRSVRHKKTLAQVERRARFRLSGVNRVELVDDMQGYDFEQFCAELLRRNGFEDVEVTQESGDHGVDILAEKDDIRYAIQCKNYSSRLGNTPVQEIYAGKTFYHCHVGVVMTNSTFTQGAIDLADATNVILWDRERLQEFMETG